MDIKAANGKINYLRVHDVGTGWGPPDDYLNAEVIIKFENDDRAFGFQLRPNDHVYVAQAMVTLLYDAFITKSQIYIEYYAPPGVRKNYQLFRVIRKS